MPDLTFLEDTHTYLLEGQELPSVSQLCVPLRQEIYKDVPKWQLEAAAHRGTAVHEASEALDTTGKAEIDGEFLPYLTAYKTFLQEHPPLWAMIERPCYHPTQHYAGTIDRYGRVDGYRALVDIKTTYTVHKPLCRAQLNLYRLMLEAHGWPVDRLYILHLKRDGTYRLIPFAHDDELPHALLTIHHALQKRKRKGAKHG